MTRIKQALQRFMMGRYGSDKLNMWILGAGCIISIISIFIPFIQVRMALALCTYILLGWSIFRMMSRNTYKRYQENRRFLQWQDRVKDKNHKYFRCPKCRQQVRVPKGKGKIMVTCPKCKEKFQKKS